MEILHIHYNASKPVKSYREIRQAAKELVEFTLVPQKGYFNKAFSLSHAQVCEKPYAFFIVAGEVYNAKMFPSQVIINPQILEAPLYLDQKVMKDGKEETIGIRNSQEVKEQCVSFPFRKEKKLTRYDRIKIRYQIPSLFGLKTITEWADKMKSMIFQHEYDHTQGNNIYFEKERPIKWWELNEMAEGGEYNNLDAKPPSGEPNRVINRPDDLT